MTRDIFSKLPIIIVALVGLLFTCYVGGALAEVPAVTHRYLFDLTGQGTDGQLDRPHDVFVDQNHGEVFVADTFNHRIKIFNTFGMLLFQFGSERSMRVPSNVAVDSRGFIYVMHNGAAISLYNYRGVYLKTFSFDDLPFDVELVNPVGFTLDGADRLYVVMEQPKVKRVLVFGPDGSFIKSFRIMADLGEKLTKESFTGKPYVAKDGTLFVSNPMVGTVYVYSPEGEFVRTIGTKGSAPGRLTFPVDVVVDGLDQVFVLDQMRHTVVVYDREGNFLSEFGGYGGSDGSFASPSSIALDSDGRAYITQSYKSRVQVLQLSNAGRKTVSVSSTKSFKKGGESLKNRGVLGDTR